MTHTENILPFSLASLSTEGVNGSKDTPWVVGKNREHSSNNNSKEEHHHYYRWSEGPFLSTLPKGRVLLARRLGSLKHTYTEGRWPGSGATKQLLFSLKMGSKTRKRR